MRTPGTLFSAKKTAINEEPVATAMANRTDRLDLPAGPKRVENAKEPLKVNTPSNDNDALVREAQAKRLAQKAMQGSNEAFSALMELYRERVFRLTLHMVGNQEDAYDLSQETFVRVYRSLASFDTKRAFTPWVYRIAHNVIIDHFRRKQTRPALADLDDEWPLEVAPDNNADNPEQALVFSDVQRQVRAAIQSLPENYRDVVVFRFVDDLSYAEIAEALDLTEANVMMRMSRARRMLRERLQHLQVAGLAG